MYEGCSENTYTKHMVKQILHLILKCSYFVNIHPFSKLYVKFESNTRTSQ